MAALAAVYLTACGGGDQAEITKTIERFYAAASKGDGEEACKQLTTDARTPVSGLECEVSINQLGRLGGGTAKRRLAAVEVSDVRVEEDEATALVRIPTQTPVTLRLEKVRERVLQWKSDDAWKISSLGTAPGGAF